MKRELSKKRWEWRDELHQAARDWNRKIQPLQASLISRLANPQWARPVHRLARPSPLNPSQTMEGQLPEATAARAIGLDGPSERPFDPAQHGPRKVIRSFERTGLRRGEQVPGSPHRPGCRFKAINAESQPQKSSQVMTSTGATSRRHEASPQGCLH